MSQFFCLSLHLIGILIDEGQVGKTDCYERDQGHLACVQKVAITLEIRHRIEEFLYFIETLPRFLRYHLDVVELVSVSVSCDVPPMLA